MAFFDWRKLDSKGRLPHEKQQTKKRAKSRTQRMAERLERKQHIDTAKLATQTTFLASIREEMTRRDEIAKEFNIKI